MWKSFHTQSTKWRRQEVWFIATRHLVCSVSDMFKFYDESNCVCYDIKKKIYILFVQTFASYKKFFFITCRPILCLFNCFHIIFIHMSLFYFCVVLLQNSPTCSFLQKQKIQDIPKTLLKKKGCFFHLIVSVSYIKSYFEKYLISPK